MKIGALILWSCLGATLCVADTTNLVEILRNFQKELDAKEAAARSRSKPGAVVATPLPPTNPPAVSTGWVERGEAPVREVLLAPQDVISVVVLDEPGMSLPRGLISADGTVELPVVGPVKVGGKTVGGASERIREVLAKDYLVSPRVTVTLLERAERSFTILQNVMRPGTHSWSGSETISLLRAIGMAGGPTRSAALSRIIVRRVVAGKAQAIPVDLDALIRDRNAEPFVVFPGDVIEVGSK